MRAKIKVWIENDKGEILFGEGKTKLLEMIEELGSISKAAQECGIDYKKAWNHVKLIEEKIKDPIIVRKKGGKDGGGSTLTPKGKELIEAYKNMREEMLRLCDEKYSEHFIIEGKPIVLPSEEKS
ncbi:winged helix-turn-helix domain-containing protein [Wolinella succinogenes]|uniref:winged helix-turn-helix domain-containing protein n=1 Tax=Wolinella succinogenes TaxID=844 RepID=UPI00240A3E08|nr:LysR family transcriptional regulator [Wolinella succinogenes]